jgi:hypothetical protein
MPSRRRTTEERQRVQRHRIERGNKGEAFEGQPSPKALNPKWWGILAPLPWWLRWSVTILAFIVGTVIGLVVASVIYLRLRAP